MRFKSFILILLIIVMTGCFAQSTDTTLSIKSQPVTITLTPVDLFKGDAAKFKPFLGSMSGAFKLEYEGSKPNASLDLEIWKNGRKVDSAGSVGDLFHSSPVQKNTEVEVIVSVDMVSIEGKDEFSTIKVCTVNQSGSSLATVTIPWDKKLTARGWIQDTGPHTFTAHQPVNVFGLVASSSNSIRTGGLSSEDLSTSEWALVFTLRFEE